MRIFGDFGEGRGLYCEKGENFSFYIRSISLFFLTGKRAVDYIPGTIYHRKQIL